MYSRYVDTGYFSATASQDTIHYTFPSTNTSRELKLASNQLIRDLWMTPDYVFCRIETSASHGVHHSLQIISSNNPDELYLELPLRSSTTMVDVNAYFNKLAIIDETGVHTYRINRPQLLAITWDPFLVNV
jgi:hypothetical protein